VFSKKRYGETIRPDTEAQGSQAGSKEDGTFGTSGVPDTGAAENDTAI
jgi:hypothetical protein